MVNSMKKLLKSFVIIGFLCITINSTYASTLGRRAAACMSAVATICATSSLGPTPPTVVVNKSDRENKPFSVAQQKHALQILSKYPVYKRNTSELKANLTPQELYANMKQIFDQQMVGPVDQSNQLEQFDNLVKLVFSETHYNALVEAGIHRQYTQVELRALAVMTSYD